MVLIFSFSIKGDHHLARARFFSDEFFNEESESERVYIYIRTVVTGTVALAAETQYPKSRIIHRLFFLIGTQDPLVHFGNAPQKSPILKVNFLLFEMTLTSKPS